MERRNVSFEQVKAKIEAKRNTEPMINPTHPNQYITEEQWIEDHFDEVVPCKNQEEMRKELMKAAEEKLNETENIGRRARFTVSVFAWKYHSLLRERHFDRHYGSKENSCVPESIAIHFL